MESILTLFVFYVSIVFGFQHAHRIADFIGAFFGLDNPPLQLLVASVILTITFFGLAQWIRKSFVPASNSESGCLINLVTMGFAIWLIVTLSIKSIFYLSGVPADAIRIPAEPLQPLIWHERMVDGMIQFWFTSTDPYFLYHIISGGGSL